MLHTVCWTKHLQSHNRSVNLRIQIQQDTLPPGLRQRLEHRREAAVLLSSPPHTAHIYLYLCGEGQGNT